MIVSFSTIAALRDMCGSHRRGLSPPQADTSNSEKALSAMEAIMDGKRPMFPRVRFTMLFVTL